MGSTQIPPTLHAFCLDSFAFLFPVNGSWIILCPPFLLQRQPAVLSDAALLLFLSAVFTDHHARDAVLRVELDLFRLYCLHHSLFPFRYLPFFWIHNNPEGVWMQSEEPWLLDGKREMKGISRPDILDRILSDGWVENIDTDNVYFYIPASDSKTDYKAIPLIAEDDDLRSVYRQSAKVISIDKTDNALTMEKITQVIEIMVEASITFYA
jgi:hypothetical protein